MRLDRRIVDQNLLRRTARRGQGMEEVSPVGLRSSRTPLLLPRWLILAALVILQALRSGEDRNPRLGMPWGNGGNSD
jgi:hypothetical protein